MSKTPVSGQRLNHLETMPRATSASRMNDWISRALTSSLYLPFFFCFTADDSNDLTARSWQLNLSGVGIAMNAESIASPYLNAECFISTV